MGDEGLAIVPGVQAQGEAAALREKCGGLGELFLLLGGRGANDDITGLGGLCLGQDFRGKDGVVFAFLDFDLADELAVAVDFKFVAQLQWVN